jgi:hypothetical protein
MEECIATLGRKELDAAHWYSVYLLYWYKKYKY